MIVDDDESVLSITKELLDYLGYKTVTATTGESALEIYTKDPKAIDLILLDLSMPGMGGRKCLNKLIEFAPDVKVVIASGYSGDSMIKRKQDAGAQGYLTKPYKVEDISRVLREALDRPPKNDYPLGVR